MFAMGRIGATSAVGQKNQAGTIFENPLFHIHEAKISPHTFLHATRNFLLNFPRRSSQIRSVAVSRRDARVGAGHGI